MIRHCVNCGADIDDSEKFCAICGAKQDNVPQEATSTVRSTQPSNKSHNRIVIFVIFVVAIIIAAFVIVAFIDKDDEESGNYVPSYDAGTVFSYIMTGEDTYGNQITGTYSETISSTTAHSMTVICTCVFYDEYSSQSSTDVVVINDDYDSGDYTLTGTASIANDIYGTVDVYIFYQIEDDYDIYIYQGVNDGLTYRVIYEYSDLNLQLDLSYYDLVPYEG